MSGVIIIPKTSPHRRYKMCVSQSALVVISRQQLEAGVGF